MKELNRGLWEERKHLEINFHIRSRSTKGRCFQHSYVEAQSSAQPGVQRQHIALLTPEQCNINFDRNYGEHNLKSILSSKDLSILAGTTSLVVGGVIINVFKAIPHEFYRNTTYFNDIAMLKLEEPLVFSASIKAIPLATSALPAAVSVTVTGWGQTGETKPTSNNLLYLSLFSTTQAVCYSNYKLNNAICLAHKGVQGSCYVSFRKFNFILTKFVYNWIDSFSRVILEAQLIIMEDLLVF